MSDPRTKAERSGAKDARQRPTQDQDPPRRCRSRLPKIRKPERPFVVEHLSAWFKEWIVVGRYPSRAEAGVVMEKWVRVYGDEQVRLREPEEQR